MTIAVGMISTDFLIIGADSEKSLSNLGMKMPGSKVAAAVISRTADGEFRGGRILITGAGGADYLEYLKLRIVRRVADELRRPTKNSFEPMIQGIIEEEMVDFFHNHYAPLAPSLDPQFYYEPSLIVGAQFGDDCRALWSTFRDTVTSIGWDHVATGIGAPWAQMILDPTFAGLVDEKDATLAACYAIFNAKAKATGCGQDTYIYTLRGGRKVRLADAAAIREAEDLFREYESIRNADLSMLLAGPDPTPTASNRTVEQLRTRLRAIDFYPAPKPRRGGVSYAD